MVSWAPTWVHSKRSQTTLRPPNKAKWSPRSPLLDPIGCRILIWELQKIGGLLCGCPHNKSPAVLSLPRAPAFWELAYLGSLMGPSNGPLLAPASPLAAGLQLCHLLGALHEAKAGELRTDGDARCLTYTCICIDTDVCMYTHTYDYTTV